MSKPVTIDCHFCRGKGRRPLPATYAATLAALRRLHSATCQEVHRALAASGQIKTADGKSVARIYKHLDRMSVWGAVIKMKRARPAGGDLRKRACEFRAAG